MPYDFLPGLSYSQVASWLKCRQAWKFSYRDQLVPRLSARPLFLGTVAHASLAACLLGRDPAADVQAELDHHLGDGDFTLEEVEEQQETARVGLGLGLRAHEWLQAQGPWETLLLDGVPLVEHRLFLDLPGWDQPSHGTIDWAAKNLNSGLSFVVDFKFRKQFQPEWAEDVDLQGAFYQKLLWEHGVETHGFLKFQGRAAVPRKPKVNKTGGVSRQAILTTWELYKETVEENGYNPKDYLDVKQKLEAREWFRLTQVYRPRAEVEKLHKQVFLPVARDLEHPIVYPSLGYMACRTCAYRELCVEEAKGGDVEFLKETSFKKRGEKEEFNPDDFVEFVDDV